MTTRLYDAGAFPMRSPLRCCRGDSDSFVAMQGQSVHLGLHIPILLNHICSCWLTLHQKTPWNERPKQHPIHSSFPQQVHQKCQGIFQWRSTSFLHHSMGQAVHWHFLLDRSEGAPKLKLRSSPEASVVLPRWAKRVTFRFQAVNFPQFGWPVDFILLIPPSHQIPPSVVASSGFTVH